MPLVVILFLYGKIFHMQRTRFKKRFGGEKTNGNTDTDQVAQKNEYRNENKICQNMTFCSPFYVFQIHPCKAAPYKL